MTLAPGFTSRTRFNTWSAGISASRVRSLGFVVAQARPRLQPAFAREIQPQIGERFRVACVIQIHRQHLADGRVLVFALMKRLRAAQHQQTAAALGHELLQQRHLVAREKLRFEIVEDHGVITLKSRRRFWENRRPVRVASLVLSRINTGSS